MNTYWMAGLAAVSVLSLSQAMAGEVEKELEVLSDAKVVIHNNSGEVVVETWDKPTVWFRVEHEDGCSGVDSRVEDGMVRIDVLVKKERGGDDTEARVTVKLPVGCDVSVESLSADVHASRPQGSLDVETASGDIKAEFTGQRLKLKSISGDVYVKATAEQAEVQTASGEVTGNVNARSLRVDTVSGDVRIEGEQERTAISTTSGEVKHEGTVGQLEVGSVSGDINIARITGGAELFTSGGDIVATGINLSELRAESIGGDIRFQGTLHETCNLSVSSKGGDVFVALPPDTPARFDLSSFSGDISSVHGKEAEQEQGPGKHLEVYNAAATAMVTAKTFSGDINIQEYHAAE